MMGTPILSFNDGTNPTVINGLSAIKCNRYLDGYGVPHAPGQGNIAERRRLVKIAIGCRVI